MDKKRILFVGEASFLGTGFAVYWQEVIKRLHETNDIVVAELGSYAYDDDPRCADVPWKFYPVAPSRKDERATQVYLSKPTNQFGEWRFDDVCLEFKPDIVAMIRDTWMDEFILRSPLRNNYKILWLPTIDGEPQRESWLDLYKRCDKILTYSNYGMNLLKKTARPGTNLVCVASPGADIDVFKPPENKREHKKKLGIDPDSIIIGTVARNQARKLYYDLIEAFSIWVNRSKSKGHTDLVKKTFLYLHTSYPDVGYDIGKAIRDFRVGNKVLMTYLCGNCQAVYPSFFAGEIAVCRRCGKLAAHPPNSNSHCPRHVLADIMKTFDLYVQYSICEGFGMPCVEAMSCGVPIAVVDYSAMQDHLECPTSTPINVERFFWEAIIATEQKRALPDNRGFANIIDRFVKQSEKVRDEKSIQTRDYANRLVDVYGCDKKMHRYSWDRTAAIWRNVINETDVKDQSETWLCPTERLKKPNLVAPSDNMDNNEFVNWVIGDIWGRKDMLHTQFAYDFLQSLNSGATTKGEQRIPFDRNQLVKHFIELIQHENEVEHKRIAINNNNNNNNNNSINITIV